DRPIETDSTLHAKNFNELMADLFTVSVHMRYMLEGFGANYDLSAWYARRSAFRKPSYRVNVYAGERDSVNTEMAHPELFKRLKAMRDDLCRKRSQPVYMVASGASLKEMAAMLPVTESELLKVKGFGKAKVKQFGNDFLEIIRDYCEEHEIDPETFVAEPEEESTQKQKKNGAGDEGLTAGAIILFIPKVTSGRGDRPKEKSEAANNRNPSSGVY